MAREVEAVDRARPRRVLRGHRRRRALARPCMEQRPTAVAERPRSSCNASSVRPWRTVVIVMRGTPTQLGHFLGLSMWTKWRHRGKTTRVRPAAGTAQLVGLGAPAHLLGDEAEKAESIGISIPPVARAPTSCATGRSRPPQRRVDLPPPTVGVLPCPDGDEVLQPVVRQAGVHPPPPLARSSIEPGLRVSSLVERR